MLCITTTCATVNLGLLRFVLLIPLLRLLWLIRLLCRLVLRLRVLWPRFPLLPFGSRVLPFGWGFELFTDLVYSVTARTFVCSIPLDVFGCGSTGFQLLELLMDGSSCNIR